jgi:hypothetical protein
MRQKKNALYYNFGVESNNTAAHQSWPRLTSGGREESKMVKEKRKETMKM